MPTRTGRLPGHAPIWIAIAVLYVVWGSTYLGIAIAVQTIPPFLMAAARFLLAGVVLLTWCWIREGRAFQWPTMREWRDSAIIGSLLLGGGMGMVAFGEQSVPSGIAALMVAMMPVWVAILGRIFLGIRLPRLAIAGIVIGFVGVLILIGPTLSGDANGFDAIGLAALVVSPIAWSSGSLFSAQRATLPRQPLVATGAQMVLGAATLALMAALAGEFGAFDPGAISVDSMIAFGYLTIAGSLVAFTAYGYLLRVAPLPLVSTYAYVNPVVAVILGALVLHEPIAPATAVAGVIIVVAVALLVTARGRMRSARADDPSTEYDTEPGRDPGDQRQHQPERPGPGIAVDEPAIGQMPQPERHGPQQPDGYESDHETS
ncbi:MAG: EamA family transporter [Chloroflexi bacterium]|nr:EamA family transporter [Chloroflexota bacterium]